MSYQEKDPNGPPPAYQYTQGQPMPMSQPGMPVYTYPAEGPQQVIYPGQAISQQPGQVTVLVSPALQNPPPDNLIYAVFVTVCCCWPIGIFAIIKALAAREAINRGDRQTAVEQSNTARRLSHAALGCGIGLVVISVLIIVIYMAILIPQLASIGD